MGYALHFIQDVSEPHHARGLATIGHGLFEDWVADNFESIDCSNRIQNIPKTRFTEIIGKSSDRLLISAALDGYNAYDSVALPSRYKEGAEITLSNAVIYSILAMYYFELHT